MSFRESDIFIDLNESIFGAWVGKVPEEGNEGMVYPEYIPAQKTFFEVFSSKIKRYVYPVKDSDIRPVQPSLKNGASNGIIWIHYNPLKPSPIMDKVREDQKNQIIILMNENKNLRIQLSSNKGRMDKLSSGGASIVEESRNILGKNSNRGDVSPFGFNRDLEEM